MDLARDLEDLYENAPCGYLTIGPDGRITNVNAAFCRWTGHPRESVLGKRLMDLLPIAGRMFYETHFAPLLRMQGYFNEVALDLVTPTGARLAVLANATERRADDGSVIYTRVSMFQATQRRKHERELADGLDAEKRAAELREQFIAVLGHDLRNPLAGLDGARRMLEREHPAHPKTLRILQLMGDSIARMSGLINDVMDLARGRLGGGIGVNREPGHSIEPTLAQVIDEMRYGHPERTIEARFDLTHAVDVDHARIAQMFSNLLGNAVTHGAGDRPIVVEASITDGHFELAIANGGEPIHPAAMERLFLPFYRGEVRPSMQGLGLGLYIASQIAKAHGGRLDVKSDEAETRFTFRMPIVRAEE